MLWGMGVWAFYLNEALGANRLVATSRTIEIRRIIEEADRTLRGILVEVRLNGLTIDKRIPW
jgi:formyltetrahydrofolate synthetase